MAGKQRLVLWFLAALSVTTSSWADDSPCARFQVVDRDKPHIGVASKVCRIEKDDKETIIELTDDDGFFPQETKCVPGDRIKVIPHSTLYYPSKMFIWPPKESRICVRSVMYVMFLEENAKILVTKGDYGTAAMVFNEVHARTKETDAQKAELAERWAYQYAAMAIAEKLGKHIEVTDWVDYDPQQSKHVITPEFLEAIKTYQKMRQLPPTGVLNYRTLESLSGSPIRNYLKPL